MMINDWAKMEKGKYQGDIYWAAKEIHKILNKQYISTEKLIKTLSMELITLIDNPK